MTRYDPDMQKGSRYQVRAPRASDGVGGALRNAYGPSASIPGDMASMLEMIDANSSRSRSH